MVNQIDSMRALSTLEATRPHRAEQPGSTQPVPKHPRGVNLL